VQPWGADAFAEFEATTRAALGEAFTEALAAGRATATEAVVAAAADFAGEAFFPSGDEFGKVSGRSAR
jgi:hypothetical protein